MRSAGICRIARSILYLITPNSLKSLDNLAKSFSYVPLGEFFVSFPLLSAKYMPKSLQVLLPDIINAFQSYYEFAVLFSASSVSLPSLSSLLCQNNLKTLLVEFHSPRSLDVTINTSYPLYGSLNSLSYDIREAYPVKIQLAYIMHIYHPSGLWHKTEF